MAKFRDLQPGDKIHLWTVIGPVFGKRGVHYELQCACGAVRIHPRSRLYSATRPTTGCVACAIRKYHGARPRPTKHALYDTYRKMIERCTDERSADFHRYGAAGIRVCERWASSFDHFLEDMGEKPTKEHTIDRIDGARGYEPGNCRWATRVEQNRNRRNVRVLTAHGRTQPIVAWADETGVSASVIARRLSHGWTAEDAVRPSGRRAA